MDRDDRWFGHHPVTVDAKAFSSCPPLPQPQGRGTSDTAYKQERFDSSLGPPLQPARLFGGDRLGLNAGRPLPGGEAPFGGQATPFMGR